MCEGVGEDSRHRVRHVVIHVEICMFLLECVWMCKHGIACAIRWGSNAFEVKRFIEDCPMLLN